MNKLTEKVNSRRTFAIISHPDAGKTTITEQMLLFGTLELLKLARVDIMRLVIGWKLKKSVVFP